MKVSTAIKTDLHDADLLGVECLFPCLLAVGVTGGVGVGAEPTSVVAIVEHYSHTVD